MNVLKILDPRSWIPGDEIADGMPESGLDEFLPRVAFGAEKRVSDDE